MDFKRHIDTRQNLNAYQEHIRDRAVDYAEDVPYPNYWAALDAYEMGARAGIDWVLKRISQQPGLTTEQIIQEVGGD